MITAVILKSQRLGLIEQLIVLIFLLYSVKKIAEEKAFGKSVSPASSLPKMMMYIYYCSRLVGFVLQHEI